MYYWLGLFSSYMISFFISICGGSNKKIVKMKWNGVEWCGANRIGSGGDVGAKQFLGRE